MKKTICYFLLGAVALFFTETASGGEPKWFAAPQLKQAPDLKRGLDDPVWKKGLKIPFNKLNNGPGVTDKYPTESYWLYANGNLYAGFKCHNPASPDLWTHGKQAKDSGLLFQRECLELFIGNKDGDLYYQFSVDPMGSLYDAERFDKGWEGTEKYVVKRHKGYWTAVFKIPASVLKRLFASGGNGAWSPGAFVTIDVGRTSYNADGSGRTVSAISPPGHHSPEDRMILGNPNPVIFSTNLNELIDQLKADFAQAKPSKKILAELTKASAFAAECARAGNLPLVRFREFASRYKNIERKLKNLKYEFLLDFMFSDKKNQET